MKRRAALLLALLLLCLIPAISLSASGAIPALKAGDKLTVIGVSDLGGGAYEYCLQFPDGSFGYIQSDSILTDATAQSAQSVQPATATTAPQMVWIPKSGSKYHSTSTCSNMKSPRQVTKEEAERKGFTPCKKCH